MKLVRSRSRNVKNGTIFPDEYPPDHARHARDAGYYIEGLQVLHLWLEVKLQEWLLISRHGNLRGVSKELWENAFSIPLYQAAKALFVTGKMPKKTFDEVNRFNAMRNKVMHRLFHETYEEGLVPIKLSEYNTAFDTGLKLSRKLEGVLARLSTRGKVGK